MGVNHPLLLIEIMWKTKVLEVYPTAYATQLGNNWYIIANNSTLGKGMSENGAWADAWSTHCYEY